jgi:choline dehydrogenase
MRACVRLTREIFAQRAFDPFRGREIQPGTGVQSDAQIDDFIREQVQSAYHPSCSCRMGSVDDPMAVVDPQARVIGVESLRVVDSSIMPSITNGNLNAPTIMLAEKAADHILGKPLLPPAEVPYFVAPDWQGSQR